MKKTKVEYELSDRQMALAKLYRKAYGKTVFWVKNKKVRVLNPEEVIIFETGQE